MISCSKNFRRQWKAINEKSHSFVLNSSLKDLLASGLIYTPRGALVLSELCPANLKEKDFNDLAAVEAFVNKLHLEDFVKNPNAEERLIQAFLYMDHLAQLLKERNEKFRIIMSQDLEDLAVTVRFVVLRYHESPWGGDNPDAFALENIVFWECQ